MSVNQQSLELRSMFRVQRGDWNAFLTLGTDNLAKIVILPVILIGTFQFAPEVVFGRIMPGLGLNLLIGLAVLAFLAARLGQREQRTDVTALPYGISTPVLFVYLFAIIGPVYFATNDPVLAYRVGLAAAFIGGLIEMSGALIGPWLVRVTPRAGILGTIAGVAIVWVAMIPSAIIFSDPVVGLPALFIVLMGLIGQYRFPLGLPTGLVAIGLGIVLGFLTGQSSLRFDQVGLYVPVPVVGDLLTGIRLLFSRPEILAVIVPIEIYNFIETIGNVESARAAGDKYSVRQIMLLDGAGTCLGGFLGAPFPTTVYLGHPAYKQMGGRTGYAMLTGLFLFVAGITGFFAFLQYLIPAAAIAPLLVFVGLVMTTYAFQATPAAHGVAVVFALIPHLADLLKKQLDGTILEILQRGTLTPDMVSRLEANQGVYLRSYGLLSHGAIITGLLWGSILALLIDHDLRKATAFSFVAFVLSAVGLIHAETIKLSLSPVTIGYLVLTLLLGLAAVIQSRQRSQEPATEP